MVTQIKNRGLKPRTEVTWVKINSLFIRKEGEKKTRPYAVAALSVMFILSGNHWAI